ncbi:MAG: hypothetical protein JNM56_25755 [Planctomycetia bacterium]|nr:hypothetical protein [Planctomycetia bacterium]
MRIVRSLSVALAVMFASLTPGRSSAEALGERKTPNGMPTPADVELPVANAARSTFYVEWTSFSKRNGIVKKLGSGLTGPFDTRSEAQAVVDKYNSTDNTQSGTRYYYVARVVAR